jgi:transaldolase
METVEQFKVKIFADGADLKSICYLYKQPYVKGFTTNPTLMRKAGISDYKKFAMEVLKEVPDLPVSFEVFADDLSGMLAQALAINSWGSNVNVKIPVTNTKGESTSPIIKELSAVGVKLNVTAVFTVEQVQIISENLSHDTPAIVSVFAGRIADTGIDPVPIMHRSVEILHHLPKAELLWASPREFINIIQADEIGCHIITATPDVIGKLKLLNKDLNQFSLETVQMFYNDAQLAKYTIDTA